jgi:hypothetical protein
VGEQQESLNGVVSGVSSRVISENIRIRKAVKIVAYKTASKGGGYFSVSTMINISTRQIVHIAR